MIGEIYQWLRANFFTKLELIGGVLDMRYYTITQVNTALAGKIDKPTGLWTTDTWAKGLVFAGDSVIQWLKGGGSTSRGIGFSGDGNLYVLRSTADDDSAAAVYDLVMDSAGRIGMGHVPSGQTLEVAGVVETRYAADQRFSIGMQPLNGYAAIYAYDYTGAAYIPQVIDGQTIALRPGGDDAKAFLVDGSGNVSIAGRIGTAWSGLTFGTGWTDYGGAYQAGQVKRVGDMIFLRGLVKRTSGTGVSIATLPSGLRPPAQCLYIMNTNTGAGRLDIQTDGQIVLVGGGADWVQLEGIVFSTSA